jgi:hypothetical protein
MPDSSAFKAGVAKNVPKQGTLYYIEFTDYFTEGRRNKIFRYQIDRAFDR